MPFSETLLSPLIYRIPSTIFRVKWGEKNYLKRYLLIFGLGLACQAESQSSHTKISTLSAKAFTENSIKSAKYRIPLRWKNKTKNVTWK